MSPKRRSANHRHLASGIKISRELYPRPVIDTFHYLQDKYPKRGWKRRSLRKQVCLLYIQWMVYPTNENKHLLIETVKKWRKKEKNRLGGKRSVLEKLSRKFFKECRIENNKEKVRKDQGASARRQIKEGKGRHTPEMRALFGTSEYGKWMISHQKIPSRARHWWVFSPDGEVFEVFNLAKFGRERGLDGSRIARTARNPGWQYKGWRARERNVNLEGFTPGFEDQNEDG